MTREQKTADLKERLAKKGTAEVQVPAVDNSKLQKAGIWKYIITRKETIANILPKHMTPERMSMIAFNEIKKNPSLLECSPQSLFGAILTAAQLGVEPGPMGQCFLIPFFNSRTKSYDVQFILGYKGMIDLARRSGVITNIYAHEVREKDEFSYCYGLNPQLNHIPALKDRGDILGFYAVAHLKDGGHLFQYLSVEDVEKRKDRSKAKEYGPWQSDYEEMGKKTVLRHMWKYLPVSVEIMKKAVLDETITDIEKPEESTSVYELDAELSQETSTSDEDAA
ncbi:MAG: recombinase RecT [Methanothrix sp.]|jgi:recombination protein RecT|nr:recombinase RecT [Candidatus Micrarchaeota archaeon]MDD3523906.1 recombinase RecT [Candidatus Cloacimonadota bacterium]MDD5769257.1 recombinase RecT [Methanothrix sp.]